jgi:hypothetical protein
LDLLSSDFGGLIERFREVQATAREYAGQGFDPQVKELHGQVDELLRDWNFIETRHQALKLLVDHSGQLSEWNDVQSLFKASQGSAETGVAAQLSMALRVAQEPTSTEKRREKRRDFFRRAEQGAELVVAGLEQLADRVRRLRDAARQKLHGVL